MTRIQKTFFQGCTALLATLGFVWSPSLAQARDVIDVSTVAQLVAAVGMPGVIVKAAPGVYPITSTLMLAADTDLIGSNEMVDSNGDGVPDPLAGMGPDDFVVSGTETKIEPVAFLAQIIVGEGWNRVSQLTVVGPVGAFTALVGNVDEVTDCLLDGTPVSPTPAGRNDLCISSAHGFGCDGCTAKLTLRGNVIRDCQVGAGYGNNRTNDAQQKIHVSGNRFYRNNNALIASNQAATTSEISIVSIGNIAEQHSGAPYAVVAGSSINHLVPGVLTGSQGNHLRLNSNRDVFRNNGSGIGITVIATLNRFVNGVWAEPNNGNEARVDILNATLENTAPFNGDINLLAALNVGPGGGPSGTNNVIESLIRRSSVKDDPTSDLLLLGDAPAGSGNDVVLIGSDIAHVSTNDPLLVNTFGDDFCDFFRTQSCQ